jgi:hypothetical protein
MLSRSRTRSGAGAPRTTGLTPSRRRGRRSLKPIRPLSRERGLREAIRQVLALDKGFLVSRTKAINELKSLIVVPPEHLRAHLRGFGLARQLDRIEQLSNATAATIEHRVTIRTLRSIVARVRFLANQATELDIELLALVPQHPAGPTLLGEPRRTRRGCPAPRQLV